MAALPPQIDRTIIATVVGILIMFAAVIVNAVGPTSVGLTLLVIGAVIVLLAAVMHQLSAGHKSSGHRAQR